MGAITRAALVARQEKLCLEIEQILVDAEHWNTHVRKEGEERIDPDPDGELRKIWRRLRGLKD